MVKRSLAVLAAVELLAPERVLEFGERLSLENPGSARFGLGYRSLPVSKGGFSSPCS